MVVQQWGLWDNKRLLNALDANQLSAKWKVAAESRTQQQQQSGNNGDAMAGNSRNGSWRKEADEVMQVGGPSTWENVSQSPTRYPQCSAPLQAGISHFPEQ